MQQVKQVNLMIPHEEFCTYQLLPNPKVLGAQLTKIALVDDCEAVELTHSCHGPIYLHA